jgi:hypothetical protein
LRSGGLVVAPKLRLLLFIIIQFLPQLQRIGIYNILLLLSELGSDFIPPPLLVLVLFL